MKSTLHNKAYPVGWLARLILGVAVLVPVSHSADSLSLEEAMAEGLRSNLGISIARNQQISAENTRQLAGGGLLPKLEAQANVGYTGIDNQWDPNSAANVDGLTTRQTAGAKLVLNWTLFDGFRMFRAYEAVHENADLGQTTARLQMETLVVQVASAWLQLAARQQALLALQEATGITARRVGRQQERQLAGSLSSRELLRAQVELQADSAQLMEGELAFASAQSNLNIALGRAPGLPVAVRAELEIPPAPTDTAQLLQDVLKGSAELEQLRRRRRAAELTRDLQKGLWWPQLQLTGSYGLASTETESPTNNVGNFNTEAAVGLSLRWVVLNGLQDKVGLQNAILEQQNADLELRRRELQVRAQVHELWLRAHTSRRRAVFEENSMDLARQNMEVARELHGQGQLTSLELRDAEQQWLQASLRRIDAVVQARLAQLELEKAAGKIQL